MESLLSIADVAARTGWSVHTLRYYERIGLMQPVARAGGGQRRYRESDLAWLAFLQRLRETDMPIRDMLRFARLRSEGDSTIAERRAMLQAHLLALRERMARLEGAAQALDEKIGHYACLETRLGGAEAPLPADEVSLHSPVPQGADDANTPRPTPTEHSPSRRSSARRV